MLPKLGFTIIVTRDGVVNGNRKKGDFSYRELLDYDEVKSFLLLAGTSPPQSIFNR